MRAAIQARLLLTDGEGDTFAALADSCDLDGSFCAGVGNELRADAGLDRDEQVFFGRSLEHCDPEAFASMRSARGLPLDLRERAWSWMADAGLWSPELTALVDEHIASDGGVQRFGLMTVLLRVQSGGPELLAATQRLIAAEPLYARMLSHSPVAEVKAQACAVFDCDGGWIPEDAGTDPEELAACALQRDRSGRCLDRLATIDWAIARAVSLQLESKAQWAAALRAFETHEEFVRFATEVKAVSLDDGGFQPSLLNPKSLRSIDERSKDGLENDELAASCAVLAPELKGAFFAETGEPDGGVLLSGWNREERFRVGIRLDPERRDSRAVLALLNVMAARSGTSKRFFVINSRWGALVDFDEPNFIARLLERKLIVLEELK